MTIIDGADAQNYNENSILKDLPCWEVVVDIKLPSETLAQIFEREPSIPGIILTDSDRFVGMISRRVFFEFMSRKYSLGLFAEKAIANLYNFLQPEVLVMGGSTKVTTATQIALARSNQLVYEPIVIEQEEGKSGIISVQQLLLVHSQIYEQTLLQLQQLRKRTQQKAENLGKLQQKYALVMHQQISQAVNLFAGGVTQKIKNPTNAIAAAFLRSSRYQDDLINLVNCYQQQYTQPSDRIQVDLNRLNPEHITDTLHKTNNSTKSNLKTLQTHLHHLETFWFDRDNQETVDIHEIFEQIFNLFQHKFKAQKIEIIKEYIQVPLISPKLKDIDYAFFYLLEYITTCFQLAKTIHPRIELITKYQENITEHPEKGELKISLRYSGFVENTLNQISENLSVYNMQLDLKLMMINYIICEQNQGSCQLLDIEHQDTPHQTKEFIIVISI